MLRKIFLLNFILFSFVISQTFEASLDKSKVGLNERFEVSFTFSGGDINQIQNFRTPDFGGLSVLSGPNRSSSMQIINGKVNSSLTYSFYLVGRKIGKYDISESSVTYNGKVYKSKSLKVSVIKSVETKSSNSGITEEQFKNNLFIKAVPSKKNVYKGEQIIVIYKLYTRLNISSPKVSSLPKYQDFWAEELEMPANLKFDYEMVDGERFQVTAIKKVALFPTKTGKLKITPFELTIPVVVQKKQNRRNNVFDDFFNDPFFSRTETIERLVASNSISVNVKELKSPQPKNFSGGVGQYNFRVKTDKKEVNVNEPIAISLELNGKGNINLTQMPEVIVPDGFEVYDPKITEHITNKNSISGTKKAEYLIIPRVSGERKIDAIEFTYFDVNKKKYQTQRYGPFFINVNRGNGEIANSNTSGFTKEEIQLLNRDLRFIKTKTNFTRIQKKEIIAAWFYPLNIGMFLVFLIIYFYLMKRQSSLQNVDLLNFKKADKSARKRLSVAKKYFDNNNLPEFYTHLSEAIYGFIEIKLKMPKSDFTLSKAIEKLTLLGVKTEIISEFKEIIETSEFMRFAQSQQTKENSNFIYERAVKLILDLDKEFEKVIK